MRIRPISISLSPNTEFDDVFLAFRLLFQPWRWFHQSPVKQLEKEFREYLGVPYAFAFNSGRSAMMAILHSLSLQRGDEILLQAFTCNAVPNPILWEGLKPVYVDCNIEDFNMSVEDLQQKLTKKSRAVVIQHTFGLPADIDAIAEVCQRHGLMLIEDCAHALGARYKGKVVGTFGTAAFFSFSRDKVISSVYGGIAVTTDKELAKRMKLFSQEAGTPSFLWTLQQLLHPPLLSWKILPVYRILGKYILLLFQWLRVLSKAVHAKEKQGKKPSYFPKQLPGALALLAFHQLKKLDRFNAHRKELARLYEKGLKTSAFGLPKTMENREHVYLRFPVRHKQAHEIIRRAWKQNLLLGDWYTSPVAPDDTIMEKVGYTRGTCPNAEALSMETLNLPTHINISKADVKSVLSFLQSYGN